MSASASPDGGLAPLPFEAALESLEQIVADLESGAIGLEESLSRFELGVRLLRSCYRTLEDAELRIEQLTGMNAAGECTTQPFDAAATFEPPETPPRKPRSRRAAGRAAENEQTDDPDRSSASSFDPEPPSLF